MNSLSKMLASITAAIQKDASLEQGERHMLYKATAIHSSVESGPV